MATKRAFILGAGFSKQADMPTASNITHLLLEKFKGVSKASEYFQYLQASIKWLEGNTCEDINFEQLFDFMPFDIELYKMFQQLLPPNHKAGRELNLRSWLDNMKDILVDIILEEEEKARKRLESIKRFSSRLKSDDVVLTFNYDTLLEKSLDLQKIKCHYGFKKENGNGVKILKMHGSINWMMVCRKQGNKFKYDVLADELGNDIDDSGVTTSNNYNVLCRIPDNEIYHQVKARHLQMKYKKKIAIVGLGTYKRVSDLVGSGEIWSYNAYKALRNCEHIYVIGFSFSQFDTMARLHFGRVMMERFENKIKLPKITLVDPDANNLNKRIESIFSREATIELIPKKAEEVDWDELLG